MQTFRLSIAIVACVLALQACSTSQAARTGSNQADKPSGVALKNTQKAPGKTTPVIKPANPVTQALRKDARSALDSGDLTGATRSLERALRIDARDAETYLLFAHLRNTQGNRKSALQLIDKALSLRPAAKTASELHKLRQSINKVAIDS